MKTMFKIIVIGGLIYIGYEIFKKSRKKQSKEEGEKTDSPITDLQISQKSKEPLTNDKRDYIYSSMFRELYDKFSLNVNDSFNFFNLLNICKKQGIKVFFERFSECLKNNSSLDELNLAYQDLKVNKIRLNFKLSKEEQDSVKIFRSSIKKNLKEFNLVELADQDFYKATIELLHENFNAGKEQSVQNFEVYIDNLNMFNSKGFTEKMEEYKLEILQRIEKELAALQ